MATHGELLLLRPREVAERLAIGKSKAYSLIASGEIPSIRIGRSVRVVASDLREWVEARTAKAN